MLASQLRARQQNKDIGTPVGQSNLVVPASISVISSDHWSKAHNLTQLVHPRTSPAKFHAIFFSYKQYHRDKAKTTKKGNNPNIDEIS